MRDCINSHQKSMTQFFNRVKESDARPKFDSSSVFSASKDLYVQVSSLKLGVEVSVLQDARVV